MIRWLLVTLLALLLINGLWPGLKRLGLGRLPGDLRLRWRGREICVPIASALVISGVLNLLAHAL